MRTLLLVLLLVVMLAGCAGRGKPAEPAQPPKTPPRPAEQQQRGPELAPGWTPQESERAAAALARSCLAGPWLPRFKQARGKPPTVALGGLVNSSPERADPGALRGLLRRELARGEKLKIADAGADHLLIMRLAAMVDATESARSNAVLLSLLLVELESAEVVWTDHHRLRRLITPRPGGGVRVQRLEADQVADLSGAFNDYDAAAVVTAAIEDLEGSAWLRGATRPLVLRVFPLRNRTDERISPCFLLCPLERALVRHPGVRLVVGPDLVERVRQRRAGAAAAAGQELGVTHVVASSVHALTERRPGGVTFVSYHVAYEAVSVGDDRKVWVFTRPVQKVVQAAPAGATIR